MYGRGSLLTLMKPESFILSTAILLVAVEESAPDVLKSIQEDLVAFGIVPQFSKGTVDDILCCIDEKELHIDVSGRSEDVAEVIESTLSLMSSAEYIVPDEVSNAFRRCNIVVRFCSEDDSVFAIEDGEAVVYVRPRLTTIVQLFKTLVERIAERYHGLVYDPCAGTAYTTKSGFGRRII